jgi:hypothetical protein
MVGRVRHALRDFPGDLLFVHRDAEQVPLHTRVLEIERGVGPGIF